MNIEYANSIALCTILDKMGFSPVKIKKGKRLYYLPFPNENPGILTINEKENIWEDSEARMIGTPIMLVCYYLRYCNENHTIADALRWLKNMIGYAKIVTPDGIIDHSDADSCFKILETYFISKPSLLYYLEDVRGISFDLAKFLLREVKVKNLKTGKISYTLGVRNEEGGFVVRNSKFKANIGPTDITFIRGKIYRHGGINIFKDVWDYLAALTLQNGIPFDDDVLILNSLSCMSLSTAYIRNYGYVTAYTWMDNSETGNAVTNAFRDFFLTEPNLRHVLMNDLYAGHKDVNDYLIARKDKSF